MTALAFGPRRDPGRPFLAGLVAVSLLGLSSATCGRRGVPASAGQRADTVVARVAEVPITASDVAAQLARTPGLTVRQALDQRITFEVLAQAAAADPPPPTADDLAERKKVEVERLVERDIEPQLRPESIPESDVRALYERGKRRFVHGRLVQTTVLCVFTGARMKAERRATAQENAKLLDAYLKAHPALTSAEMEAVAQQPAWTDRKVSVTTVWQDQEQGDPFPPVLAHALAALHQRGDRTPLVGDETGYYIGLYVAEQPAANQSFKDVAPDLRLEMFEPWRRQRFLRLTKDLSAGHDIAVFPENLALSDR